MTKIAIGLGVLTAMGLSFMGGIIFQQRQTLIERAKMTDAVSAPAIPQAPLTRHLRVSTRTETNPLNELWLYFQNLEHGSLHNVRICINDLWCVKRDVILPCGENHADCEYDNGFVIYRNPPFPQDMIKEEMRGRYSQFQDRRGVSLHDRLYVETVTVVSDEGSWSGAN